MLPVSALAWLTLAPHAKFQTPAGGGRAVLRTPPSGGAAGELRVAHYRTPCAFRTEENMISFWVKRSTQ
jgi:hypothetical protein